MGPSSAACDGARASMPTRFAYTVRVAKVAIDSRSTGHLVLVLD